MEAKPDEQLYWVAVKVVGFDKQNQAGVMKPIFWSTSFDDVKTFMSDAKSNEPDLILYPKTWIGPPDFNGKHNGLYCIPKGVSPTLEAETERVRGREREDVEREKSVNLPVKTTEWNRPNSPKVEADDSKHNTNRQKHSRTM